MTVRLYGRVVGHGSHAQVTSGFSGALREAKILDGLVALDRDLPPDAPQPGGAVAPVAIFTGPLGYLQTIRRGTSHRARYAMVAPNSSLVPRDLVRALEGICTGILVPSRWGAGVLAEQTGLPVTVVPHGVAAAFAPNEGLRVDARASYARGAFNVLHLSTTERERKGTRPLIEAWAMLASRGDLPQEAKLRLVLDVEAASDTMAWMAERAGSGISNVAITVRMDLEPTRLAQVYGEHHVLCQPSRGEGFGMCGLESLASGVPIVATRCTGHSEWFTDGLPGASAVEHGPDAEIDDLPGALAPTVEPDAIAAALMEAYKTWLVLDGAAWRGAEDIRTEWAWARKLAPFIASLKETTKTCL